MKIIHHFLSWFATKKLSAAMKAAADWEWRANKIQKSLKEYREGLLAIREQTQSLWNKLESTLDDADSLQDQQHTAVDQLRNELKVLSETTVPTLVAQHKLILSRIEAETSNQVRLMVAAAGREED